MTKPTNRRDFLKVAGMGTTFFSISSPFSLIDTYNSAGTNIELFRLFQSPPKEAKPFYRWWWNGNRITKEEVFRELKIMKSSGAGGVEIIQC